MARPGAEQPYYEDGRDQIAEMESFSKGHDSALAEEAERLREKNEDKYFFIEEVEKLLLSMLQSDDLPDQTVHREKIEDLHDRAKEIEL